MNLIDADKLMEQLGENHTGHTTDYRLRMAIEAAKVDIGSLIRREIAEALRNLDALYQGKHSGYLGRAIMETADQLDPPSAEPVAPKLNPCRKCGGAPERNTLSGMFAVECTCGNRASSFVHDFAVEIWNQRNPIRPEPPACMACLDTGKCEIFCKCGAGTRAKNEEVAR